MLGFSKKLHLNICNRYIYSGASRWSPFGVIKSDVFCLFSKSAQVHLSSSYKSPLVGYTHTLSLYIYAVKLKTGPRFGVL